MDDLEVLAEGHAFLEAPRWHEGRLYVSDFYLRRVYRLDAGGLSVVCEVPGQPSGLGHDPDGHLMVVSMIDRRVLRLVDGVLQPAGDLTALAPFHCNDMVVDGAGAAYVGNFGWDSSVSDPIRPTTLVHLAPDGTATIAADDLVFPNGTVITPDGGTLIVSETFAGRITAFDIAADGSLSNRRVWADLAPAAAWRTIPEAVASGRPLPDGMVLDAEGAVWIGDAAGDGALRVAAGGEILYRVPTGDRSVYAVALGGDDRRTLYLCVSPPLLQTDPSVEHRSALLATRVEVPGAGRP